jgi:hypothetical protein
MCCWNSRTCHLWSWITVSSCYIPDKVPLNVVGWAGENNVWLPKDVRSTISDLRFSQQGRFRLWSSGLWRLQDHTALQTRRSTIDIWALQNNINLSEFAAFQYYTTTNMIELMISVCCVGQVRRGTLRLQQVSKVKLQQSVGYLVSVVKHEG